MRAMGVNLPEMQYLWISRPRLWLAGGPGGGANPGEGSQGTVAGWPL